MRRTRSKFYLHRVIAKGRTYFYARSPDGKLRIPLGQDESSAEQSIRLLSVGRSNAALSAKQIALINFIPELLYGAKARARTRQVAFDLTIDDIVGAMRAQDFRCAVTGMEFSLTLRDGKRPFAPSIDRIRAGGPYIADNVRVTTRIANLAMNAWGDKPLKEMKMLR